MIITIILGLYGGENYVKFWGKFPNEKELSNMKLINLTLKGFIGLKKGLGLDELSLPLADLAGLVAFDGPNGRGKTTILENMQPFRQFASRRGTLKSHCFAKDSQKELTFEHNGDIIRTLIKMDAHTTRSDEGYIWLNDKPMVDGKVTSYDAAIKEIFGSPNLFFWSIFCAQNSKKLTDLTAGKLKELFTEFLRLDRYAVYEDTIKQAMSMLTGIGQAAGSDKISLENELAKFAHTDMRPAEIIKHEGQMLEENQKLLDQKAIEIGQLRRGIEDQKAKIAANEEKAKQRKALSLDLVAAKSELDDLEKEKAGKLTAIAEKMTEIDSEIKAIHNKLENAEEIKQAADRCFNLDYQIKRIAGEIDIADRAREQAQDELNDLNQDLVDKMRIVDECKNSQLVKRAEDDLEALEKRRKEVEDQVIDQDPEFTAMRVEHAGLVTRSEALDQKDKDCISQTCGLIVDAIQAEKDAAELADQMAKYTVKWHNGQGDSLDEIKGKISEARDQVDRLIERHNGEIKEAEKNLSAAKAKVKLVKADLETVITTINKRKTKKAELMDEFESLSDLAKQLPGLEIARARLDGREKQEAECKAELAALEKEYGAKYKAAQAKIDLIADRMAEIKIDEAAGAELETMQKGLAASEEYSKRLLNQIRESEHKILDAQRTQEKIDAIKADLAKAESRFKVVAGEQRDWQYLKEACGKKGLQALEIDGVSPTIEAYANDLLISTFGPMNTIRFETIDDDGKEVLNIVVMDPDGSEALLELKSGGEQVWILKALRLALTLLSKEKSGRNFKTVLMDEEDGALSPANAVRFINLYRSMMDLGGFDTCFYISHKPEAVALANHRLVFNDNRVVID